MTYSVIRMLYRGFMIVRWKLVLLGLLLTTFQVSAQVSSDSVKVSYSEEVATDTARAPLRVQREERDFWKLGLNNFSFNGPFSPTNFSYPRYGVHIAYERKLRWPAWSLLGEVSPAIARHYKGPFYTSENYRWDFNTRAQLASRYYHNLERRLRQGRSVGNFSANYFSLALGASLGRYGFDTPFRYSLSSNNFARVELALLYGIQRRFGRYGFVDVNLGLSKLLTPIPYSISNINIAGSLRVGLALGATTRAPYPSFLAEDDTPQPRVYVGLQLGSYAYLHTYKLNYNNSYSNVYSYFESLAGLYPYVGYYIQPRLAVQLGVQCQEIGAYFSNYSYNLPITYYAYSGRQRDLVLPLLMRYNLTQRFMQRVQFDAVAGFAFDWHATSGTFEVMSIDTDYHRQALATIPYTKKQFNIYPLAGLNVSYGVGRRRQLQATAEYLLIKNQHTNPDFSRAIQTGVSLGLRYRFLYREPATQPKKPN